MKRAIQNISEATGNLIGNKIDYKIISAPSTSITPMTPTEEHLQKQNTYGSRKYNRKYIQNTKKKTTKHTHNLKKKIKKILIDFWLI